MADKNATPPQTGGVTSKNTSTPSEANIFNTKGNEPVRDRKADPSKGQPVTRYFTKDGTPVEPSSINGNPSKDFATAGPDPSTRDDVVTAVEYVDETGATVTHDNLKAKHDNK